MNYKHKNEFVVVVKKGGLEQKIFLRRIISDPGDSDDLLDEKYTDKNGEFALTGTTRELTDIEPVLYIYHDCDDGIRVRSTISIFFLELPFNL